MALKRFISVHPLFTLSLGRFDAGQPFEKMEDESIQHRLFVSGARYLT